MISKNFHLNVVTTERKIFFGLAKKIHLTGIKGELGIFPGHSPLLSVIIPCVLHIVTEHNSEEYIYLSGGILEAQSNKVTVLANIAFHSNEIDEKEVIETKLKLEKDISYFRYNKNFDYNQASFELTQVLSKLRVIQLTKKRCNLDQSFDHI